MNTLLADRVTGKHLQMHREAIEMAKMGTPQEQGVTAEQGSVTTTEAETTEAFLKYHQRQVNLPLRSEQPQQQEQDVSIEIDEATGQKKLRECTY